MLEPNDHLRRARERVESPNATGEPLSRQELAELVNAWVYDNTNPPRVIATDANYVGQLERGRIRWPQDRDRRAGLRAVLGVPTDADLGFRRPRRSRSTVADVDCQQLIRAALGTTAGTVGGPFAFADLITLTQPTPVPAVVGHAEVAEVRNAAAAFSGWDARYGGGLVREAVVAQLRYCVELLDARCTDHVRADMFSAVGYLAHVTGFMAFDAYAHDDARRMFRFALQCAEKAGDWHLRAKVLSSMARQAIWCGDPDAGLTFTELAMVRADRLTATERAMLHTGRARALAKLARVQEVASAVGVADDEFSHARPVNDPVYMRYYDAAQHAGDTGHALWDVAVHGHFISEARHRLSTAVTGHGEEFARARAMSQIKLSSLVMLTGDPCEAAAIGGQALDATTTIRSRRAADDMRDLRRFGEPHERLTAVAELIHRIGSVVVV
ncbi:MAG: XRE family transcriptional regulator [Pseudonocardiaceae bacterium]